MILSLLISWQLIVRFPAYSFQPVPSNSFAFSGSYPAFFVVTQAQAMNLTNATISATFSLSNSADVVFKYGGEGVWNFGRPASAHLFFATKPRYANQGTGSTNYWFSSNWVEIGTNIENLFLFAEIKREQWSDAGGCATCPPTTDENFWNAIANVQEIGIAFGGGDFYDVGITTTGGQSVLTMEQFKTYPTTTITSDLDTKGKFILNCYQVEQSEDLKTWHSVTNTFGSEFYRSKQN